MFGLWRGAFCGGLRHWGGCRALCGDRNLTYFCGRGFLLSGTFALRHSFFDDPECGLCDILPALGWDGVERRQERLCDRPRTARQTSVFAIQNILLERQRQRHNGAINSQRCKSHRDVGMPCQAHIAFRSVPVVIGIITEGCATNTGARGTLKPGMPVACRTAEEGIRRAENALAGGSMSARGSYGYCTTMTPTSSAIQSI